MMNSPAGKLLCLLFLLVAFVMAGCSAAIPLWRQEARTVLERARLENADKFLPAEFRSVEELVLKGEDLLKEDEVDEADKLFLLAWSKGGLLEKNLAAEKQRLKDEADRREEAERLERARKLAMEEEARRIAREKFEAVRAAQEAEARRLAEKAEKAERARQFRERQLLSPYHTVKRGETLPFIASQPEVYNDRNLWPLLYRANRDQISDPRHIWPGQVLRIPRNAGRDDIAEARRYAQERPLH